jgi:hypothetical protein
MYFNKKYTRSGSLFQGPYKSVRLDGDTQLEPLIRYIHHGTNDYSSYPEYSGKRKSSWVRTITTQIEQGHAITAKEKELIKDVVIENDSEMLEGRNLSNESTNLTKSRSMIPEVSTLFAIYLLLIGVGVRNINVYASKNIANSTASTPAVLSETIIASPSPEPTTKTMILINTSSKENEFIKIHQEPVSFSPVVFEARDGDIFEFVSVNSGWYEIKLSEDLTGYVWAEDTSLLEQTIDQ